MVDYTTYMNALDTQIQQYMPQENTPLYDALVKPKDLFRIPLREAEQVQFKCIKQAFIHNYKNNQFYHRFCEEQKVTPDDLKTNQDLDKIPLIPDKFFKDYPPGKDFAVWLGNIYTGELPHITIEQKNPTFDDVIKAFYEAGIIVSYSSGTGGRYTFIPRNRQTFMNAEYALAKTLVGMAYPLWKYDMHGYLLMPNPKKNFIFAGRALEIYFDAVKNVQVAIDREVTTEFVQRTMGNIPGLKTKIVRYFSYRQQKKMVEKILVWLEERDKAKDTIALLGAPYILYMVMEKLKAEGKNYDFSERAGIATGGGWKGLRTITPKEFRTEVNKVLGVSEKWVFDVYSMVEGNGWMIHCPEGHYLHVPYSYYKALVLDKEFKPMGYGEWGRFAFLDGISTSHPSFVITGDQVKLLEHCPVCDRPGPVLEPEVTRAKGEDMRGCAEEVRRMLSKDIGK
jgi:long-chain-fatty-acid---luciferin-component ligase